MTTVRTVRRPPVGRRRAGYLVGALVDGVLLWLIHVWPGWEAVPFLTDATPQVLGLVDATLVAGIVVAGVELVWDPRRLVALGELVTSALGLAATVRVLQVFPFDLEGAWPAVVRVVLWIGVVGAAIGALVALVRLVRPAAR
ncbi:hypothetical protein [Geodermatophilus marinus]|uniref:hypothetical protein n=1 Tax=Geodermatophilus sp. LHW52908 TaxID=2303986 RepID=UPI000E3D0CBC|nr:hypothetical protein [Geodermatophilus sp. LHW52908]RFU20458.1 hypothetical protein D0Z06_16440 [Geodermatophilus sp. LHW52908]